MPKVWGENKWDIEDVQGKTLPHVTWYQWTRVIIHLSKPAECHHQEWRWCVLVVHPLWEMYFLGEAPAVGEAVRGGGDRSYIWTLCISFQFLWIQTTSKLKSKIEVCYMRTEYFIHVLHVHMFYVLYSSANSFLLQRHTDMHTEEPVCGLSSETMSWVTNSSVRSFSFGAAATLLASA